MLPSEAAAAAEAAKPPEPVKQPLTAAQEKRIRDKVACDKLVYEMQMQLLDGAISAEVRAEAAGLLQPQHYDDVVSERGIDGLCGYVGCANPVKKPARLPLAASRRQLARRVRQLPSPREPPLMVGQPVTSWSARSPSARTTYPRSRRKRHGGPTWSRATLCRSRRQCCGRRSRRRKTLLRGSARSI